MASFKGHCFHQDRISLVTDHIFMDVVDNRDGSFDPDAPKVPNLMRFQVDDYRPAAYEWDVDQWEDRIGIIYAPMSRKFWSIAWRLARALAHRGEVLIEDRNITCKLPSVMVLS